MGAYLNAKKVRAVYLNGSKIYAETKQPMFKSIIFFNDNGLNAGTSGIGTKSAPEDAAFQQPNDAVQTYASMRDTVFENVATYDSTVSKKKVLEVLTKANITIMYAIFDQKNGQFAKITDFDNEGNLNSGWIGRQVILNRITATDNNFQITDLKGNPLEGKPIGQPARLIFNIEKLPFFNVDKSIPLPILWQSHQEV